MLEDNVRNVRDSPGKIARGEFILEESRTKRRIDLSRDWDSCFLPGQRVEMSMTFQISREGGNDCPGCKATPRLLPSASYEQPDEDQDIECNVWTYIPKYDEAQGGAFSLAAN